MSIVDETINEVIQHLSVQDKTKREIEFLKRLRYHTAFHREEKIENASVLLHCSWCGAELTYPISGFNAEQYPKRPLHNVPYQVESCTRSGVKIARDRYKECLCGCGGVQAFTRAGDKIPHPKPNGDAVCWESFVPYE